jgi:hypothetical protein
MTGISTFSARPEMEEDTSNKLLAGLGKVKNKAEADEE